MHPANDEQTLSLKHSDLQRILMTFLLCLLLVISQNELPGVGVYGFSSMLQPTQTYNLVVVNNYPLDCVSVACLHYCPLLLYSSIGFHIVQLIHTMIKSSATFHVTQRLKSWNAMPFCVQRSQRYVARKVKLTSFSSFQVVLL